MPGASQWAWDGVKTDANATTTYKEYNGTFAVMPNKSVFEDLIYEIRNGRSI